MPTQDRKLSGKYDRRIQLLRPDTIADPENYNEDKITFAVTYSNFPASKSDAVTTDNESQDSKLIQATNVTEWELRFIQNHGIKSTWKLIDMMTGQIYEIISPVTEIGRGQGLRVKTRIVE